MIAGDSKNGTFKPAENPPSAEGRRIELQIQSFPLLAWPISGSRPGIENGITKIDYHLYPVRATLLLLFVLVLLFAKGVSRGFQPKPELIIHLLS
jgi:hypothetical protein